MLARTLFDAGHDAFRSSARRFFAEDVVPFHDAWEDAGQIDRKLWNRAGELGLLCCAIPAEYGGAGGDRLHSVVMMEEQLAAGASGVGFVVHSDIVANYLLHYGSEEQKRTWLPRMASGETVGAIAMTEPGTGSDLQSIRTVAREDGDDYVIDGAKMFISNGLQCDLAIVAVRMDDQLERGAKAISLILVEADRPGFVKGKALKKVGLKAQDTAPLHFDQVRVPKRNVLGGEAGVNQGFMMLMQELAWERLIIAITSITGAETAFALTREYVQQRQAFGRPVAAFQNTRFKLAEMKSEIAMARVFVDRCTELVLRDELPIDAAAAAKYLCSDLLCKVVDECVQLHGGYGYMLEYPIARAYVDARAQRIYGGTNEIMKEIIARSL
ncbi:acyl-CoA dehydrogenase family protein [Lysobacter sp. TAB13]|jgi:long-chain-acyl-CoA dehydrogenase|uniref:acyl-CoA dehydrogenase family protein n=1 Tax=Lysobacter sp. TAB13 TaxID=3233065 RepID=UPI003F9CA4C1